MNQKFSQDFTGLFKWNDISQEPQQTLPKTSPAFKSRLILAAEALDNSGIGITQKNKLNAVELIKRIHNYNSNNRIQYD
jgi:hypothetical protein